MQTGNTSTMIFTVAEIIEHLSSLMTLYTGDVISLTIDGLGQQLKPSIKTPDSYSSAGEIFLAN